MTANLIPVKYIGKKESKRDETAGTGLVWLKGQIHYVPAIVAAKLTVHKDIWAEAAEEADANPSAVGLVVDSLPDDPNRSVIDETSVPVDLPNLQGMKKADLQEYAERTFHVTLDSAAKKEEMVDKIVSLRNAQSQHGEQE